MAIDLGLAKNIIKAALSEAEKRKLLVSVAVVDDKGSLIAFYRMIDAPIPTVDIARNKAWTAATFRMPSSEIKRFGDPAMPNCGFNTQNENDRLTTIAGGIPIKDGDKVIGSIGICGGSPDEDAKIGLIALKKAFIRN